MLTISGLPASTLQDAVGAADTLIRFREYLPPGGMLVMLLGKFRDDARDELELDPVQSAYRGREQKSLDELTSAELGRLQAAVTLLLERFGPSMDDPELVNLIGDLQGMLTHQAAEREQIRQEVGA